MPSDLWPTLYTKRRPSDISAGLIKFKFSNWKHKLKTIYQANRSCFLHSANTAGMGTGEVTSPRRLGALWLRDVEQGISSLE